MEVATKLKILADSAKYDASCASSGVVRRGTPGGVGNSDGTGLCHSYTPDGRCVSLLKVLLTNFCIFDCQYCVNRVSSDVPRARFAVQEVVDLTLDFYRRNYIEGLFLSSGIIQSADYTTEQLVEVARLLRVDHRFGGYIHLKIIPGAAAPLIAAAGTYADRVSVNIELPVQGDLDRLAPEKSRASIESSMAVVRSHVDAAGEDRLTMKHARSFAPAGQTTQMIVGASSSNDAVLLRTASELYDRHHLRRVYYSAFSPFPQAPGWLPPLSPPRVREHRLYQADWLLRYYGFSHDELTTAEAPDLPLHMTPKLAWALRHPEVFPVDVNTAPRELLLRVPGIGYQMVKRLLRVRRHHRLELRDMKKLQVRWSEARHFIVTADSRPTAPTRTTVQPVQQRLL
jgi:putative DNA modification/repair radical SAM protein